MVLGTLKEATYRSWQGHNTTQGEKSMNVIPFFINHFISQSAMEIFPTNSEILLSRPNMTTSNCYKKINQLTFILIRFLEF